MKTLKQKPIWILLILLLVGGGLAFSFKSTEIEANDSDYHVARRSNFLVSIVEGGTLTATSEHVVRNETDYTLQIIRIVPEGTVVKEGDLLLELDSSTLRDKIAAQELSVESAILSHESAIETLDLGTLTWEAEIEEEELSFEFSKSDLEKYRLGAWPIILTNFASKIKISEEELERSRDRLEKTKTLKDKGYATAVELRADELSVTKQELNISQYKFELQIAEKYDHPKQIRLLESRIKDADLDLRRTRQKAKTSLRSYVSTVASKARSLVSYRERLAGYKEQLALCKVVAPRPGLVVYQPPSSYRYPGIEVGASISSKYRILKLPDVSQMMLDIMVHESHVRQVKSGLPCYITIDSLPDKKFTGFVRRVAPLPDTRSRYYNPNLKVYKTEVWINEQLSDLKPGVSGRAEIVVTNLTDVVTVPLQCVTTIGQQQVCIVRQGTENMAVPVEVGLFNDTMIEIRSGVEPGDEVLLSPISMGDAINIEGGFVSTDDLDGPGSAKVPSLEELRAAQQVGLQDQDFESEQRANKAKSKEVGEDKKKVRDSVKKPKRVKTSKKKT
jgi:HlyD family secretion protein